MATQFASLDFRSMKRLEKAFRKADDKLAGKVVGRAVRKTGRKGSNVIRRTIQKQTSIPARLARKQLRGFAQGKGVQTAFIIQARGRAIPLNEFGARPIRRGVSARVWGKRKVFKGAFIPRSGKLEGKVFVRRSKKRLPIKRVYGPAIAKELFRGATETYVKQQWPSDLTKTVDNELKFELGKMKKAYDL